jgi:hypothetical protein
MTTTRPRAAVLVHWPETRWRYEHLEVLDRLTFAEAESVAKEARRLGADMASVHTLAAARKLYEAERPSWLKRVEARMAEDASEVGPC